MVTKLAKGFIAFTNHMITNQKKGKQVFNLKTNDYLVKVLNYDKKYLASVTKLAKLLIFDTESLPTMNKGVGVQIIKIKDKDRVSDVKLINLNDGLEWIAGNKKRKLDNIEFWIGKRAQVGKKIPKFFNKSLKFD